VSEETLGGPGGFAVGSVVAGYRLEEQIGQGGMAVVFRAHDPRLDRHVALKILAPGLALDDAFRQRFIRESRAAAAMDDPHIIPVFEAGEERGVLFIAMRFVKGGDVRSLLDREGQLSPGRATEIISQVASALDSAHARGLVHRDVKPANMLRDASSDSDRPDHIYLSDFGLTKTSLAATGLTGTGQFLGTLDYVAPEQIEGRPVDGRTDLYSLACAAFELLTGQPPFRRDQGMAVMYAQVSEPPPLLSSLRPGLPAAVDEILNRALAKSPGDRYASCREFAAALRRAFGLLSADSSPRDQATGRPATQIVQSDPGIGPGPGGAGWAASGAAGGHAAPGGPATGSATPAGATPTGGAAGEVAAESAQPPPAPSPGGPPTEAAGFPSVRPTRPGLTDPSGGSGGPGGYGGAGGPGRAGGPGGVRGQGGAAGQPAGAVTWPGQARPRWRSPVALTAIAAVVLVVVGGGGYLLLGRGSGSGNNSGGNGGPAAGAAALTAPTCTAAEPHLATMRGVKSTGVPLSGTPFAVQESKDGRFEFVTVNNGIVVLRNTGGLVPEIVTTLQIPNADKGLALTGDGRYLLAAGGQGAVVINVAEAEAGSLNSVAGTLTSPKVNRHGDGAVQVRVSRDDKFAFVTLQNAQRMAVFKLSMTSTGFHGGTFVGSVPLGTQPVGIGESPDGTWLYVTSFQRNLIPTPSEGTLSLVKVQDAETDPSHSVVTTVNAGCSPARVVTSGDGKTIWVTARDSNAVLAFSAAKLQGKNPSQALIADVPVGPGPIGLTLAANGTRLITADSNQASQAGAAGDLAVIDVAQALRRKPALLGVVAGMGQPRQLSLASGGRLLATNQGNAQLQVIKVSDLK
jgi:DNA-binding beta-propeller fold protein YncE